MSASNWAQCPKCKKLAEDKRSALKRKLETAYGQVLEQEYHRLLEEYEKKIELEDTLREDYAIGIWDDMFQVSYSGRCERCGFKKEFKAQSLIKI